ncbi:GNAT family N-acetyltransferase [Rossellomorea vietnamensis]|uniref:GNAT family N-acetyltransferase n=2 Tax=Rossellomorea TaxID=2837508 RepID=A0A5D4KE76_9BACI|nr:MULTISPECIES: GNAT family N-acetyltransferase [Rossellomorea]TYR75110.1 GNAT family N-acetyltransferase [Rossellomorea vietnamensis]TYS79866.1 GNAT family N-acetyltransferase [Rossellomorea aquimaris]
MYNKKLYVFKGDKPIEAVIRTYTYSDFKDLIRVQQESFPPPFPSELWWKEEQLSNHLELFPEGALCIEVEGEIAGSITGMIINYDPQDINHSWSEMTGDGSINTHDRNGNALYIVDIGVSPKYRGHGLGKALMQSMYEVVVQLRLERLLGGGRMPGYGERAAEMSASQYLEAVIKGELQDKVISFLLRCGRLPVGVIPEYLEDQESKNYAALMEWRNPFLKR